MPHFVISTAEADSVSSSSVPGIATLYARIIENCSGPVQSCPFKGYLIWYYKPHPRARRLNTYESVWKTLRQLYYDICHKVVADDGGEEITNVRPFSQGLSH